ncbi:MAG: hypothetical protein KGK16_00235 [Bradyrhizobium sp.]|nr:hypothetical protein [Bradyrhizobium sp.]
MADPIVPAKVRTIPIRSSDAPSPSTELPQVHVLTVRPSAPEDERDASGRPLHDTNGWPNAASAAGWKAVRTTPIMLDSTSGAPFPDKRRVRTTPLHTPSPQQDTLDMQGSRANRGPAIDRFAVP